MVKIPVMYDTMYIECLLRLVFRMVLVALAFASIAISYLVLWMPRLMQWIKERMRIIELVDRLPGPRALPLVGCAYQFSFDSYSELSKEFPRLSSSSWLF